MTREANKRDSLEDVPTSAITMGIGTVMSARKILMIVTGADKAEILQQVFGSPRFPAPGSIRRTVICDEKVCGGNDIIFVGGQFQHGPRGKREICRDFDVPQRTASIWKTSMSFRACGRPQSRQFRRGFFRRRLRRPCENGALSCAKRRDELRARVHDAAV